MSRVSRADRWVGRRTLALLLLLQLGLGLYGMYFVFFVLFYISKYLTPKKGKDADSKKRR